MLPPNLAQLAARAKAADSLGLRYTDITVTVLEGAITEATLLVDEIDRLRTQLAALEGAPADPETPKGCGAYSTPGLGGILGPCTKDPGHDGWHLDGTGAAWAPEAATAVGRRR